MKVLITNIDFQLYWKARLVALANLLCERGCNLVVVELTHKGTPYVFSTNSEVVSDYPFQWIRLFEDKDISTLSPSRIASRLWKLFEKINPDLIIAGAIAFSTGAAAVRWCRHQHRGVVIMDDVRREDVPRPWWVEHIKHRVYRNVDAMFVPAASHAKSYIDWGIPEDKIFFGVDVVDNDFFESRSRAARAGLKELRERHGLPKKFILGVGRQIPKKNWVTLVAAYEGYRQSCEEKPWDLVLVGNGPDREKLERQVLERGIEGVHFRPFCDQEKLCEYYAMAECLVLASYYGETWGLVVNEAMACGLPVLVSNQCGCAQTLVRDGENGWTFSPKNVDELANAMARIATLTKGKLGAMGLKSQAIIREWSLGTFARGAWAAIESCRQTSRGFCSIYDRALIACWKGRYRTLQKL